MFIALGLVPVQYFNFYLHALLHSIQADISLVRFYNEYYSPTWLDPRFPLSLINWYLQSYRTNNNAEAFNSRFAKRFRARPHIWKFCTKLLQIHKADLLAIDFRLLGHPLPPTNPIYDRLNRQILTIQTNCHLYGPLQFLSALTQATPEPAFDL